MDPVDALTGFLADLEQARGVESGPESLAVVRSVASTNFLAREIVSEYDREELELHPLLVLALEQRGGRGRQGRTWSSPAGKGVYATRVLVVADPEKLQSLPLLVGIGLCRALNHHLPVPCRLKWPNDLVVDTAGERKKIGGVLIEALVRPHGGATALIGFGVNHGQEAGELPENGTSLRLLGVQDTSLAQLAWDLIKGLEAELAHLGDLAYAAESYRGLTAHRPGDPLTCRTGAGTVEGTFQGFDELGRLRLRRNGEELLVASGEVLE